MCSYYSCWFYNNYNNHNTQCAPTALALACCCHNFPRIFASFSKLFYPETKKSLLLLFLLISKLTWQLSLIVLPWWKSSFSKLFYPETKKSLLLLFLLISKLTWQLSLIVLPWWKSSFSKLFYPETKKSRTKAENLPTQVGHEKYKELTTHSIPKKHLGWM